MRIEFQCPSCRGSGRRIGLRFVGQFEERIATADEEIYEINHRAAFIHQRFDNLLEENNTAKKHAISEIRACVAARFDTIVFTKDLLNSGNDMGVSSSDGSTNWVEIMEDELCMRYSAGIQWGAVFITACEPSLSGNQLIEYNSE